MVCSACGADNPPGARFCNGCGAALRATCADCGHVNPPAGRFCNQCGRALTAPVGASEPGRGPAAASPQSYTPRHLAERILATRDDLAGERKQVTVLFADIKGSTELIEGLDPEEARALLEPSVRAMIEAVHRYEGTVCRVMGDGIMALFGAPLAHEDHAARACFAALMMQDDIRRYGERTRERDGVEVQARVGLNSGEVVVGAISNDLHVEYSAIGATTHLAARMEQLAREGTVRLTAETLRLVEGLVDVAPLGRIPVKGLTEPVAAFELLGVAPTRRRLQASATRGLTPFVGRQAELDALRRALDLARAGRGQIVAPVGDPGVGKSRLFYELVRSHHTDGWLVLESGSVSYGKATAYLPVIDLLKAYCRIESLDDARAAREKLVGKVLGLDRALEPILAPLLGLLDLPVDDEAWAALEPARRRQATLDALRRLLLRESQERPLLLVFEDLHWIDAETQALLDGLVEVLPTARILLLVNYRPEYTHGWGNKSYYTQLRIDPLGQASAEDLLDALLGDDPTTQPLRELLIRRTEGNPFFVEETVRALAEAGALIGERGAYRLAHPVEEVRVPATVQAVLAARIDRLPADEKRLLQVAAVIGTDVSFPLLQAIADTPDDGLHAGLSRLQAAELLYAVSLFPEPELTFKHALTHEVAYGSLLQERRRALHARIVEAIERLSPDRLDEQVERLAHHALRGQLWQKAIGYLRQAGTRAMGRSATLQAIGYLEQALVALDHLEDCPAKVEQAIDIRFELRTACWGREHNDRAYGYLREAQQLAEAAGDRRRLGWVSVYLAHYMRATVDHPETVELGGQAIAIADETGDASLKNMALDIVSQSYHELGQFQRVIDLLGPNLAALDGASDYERGRQHTAVAITSRQVVAYCLSWQGNFDLATERAAEALHIAEGIEHPQTIASASLAGGLVAAIRGDYATAIPRIERTVAIRRGLGSEPHCSVFAFLGHAYALAGRIEAGVKLLEQSLDGAAATRHFACTALWISWLADAYRQVGRLDDAERTARQAVDVARRYRERGFEGYGLHQLGEACAAGEGAEAGRAEDHVRHALAVAEELEMRPLQAHCHLSLGKLYRRVGRLDEARAELNVAIDLYLTMDMMHWLPEAEAELTRARPPTRPRRRRSAPR